MKHKYLRSLLVLVVSIGLLASGVTALAQEGLPADQQALLEKAAAAAKAVDAYESYVEDSVIEDSNLFSLTLNGQVAQEQTSIKKIEAQQVIVRGDSPAMRYTATIEGEENGVKYTVEGELRYVEETLYGAATYTPANPAEAALFTFPEGFTVIEDPSLSAFAIFNPQSLVDELLGTSVGPFDDMEKLAAVVRSVTSEDGELDGAAVEIITLEIGADKLLDLLIATSSEEFDPDDPLTRTVFSLLTEDSFGRIALYLDEEGSPLQAEIELVINVVDGDAGEIDPSAAGFTFSLAAQQRQFAKLSQVNAVTEEITAPE